MSGLVAADLAPCRIRHVVGERDEVEPGAALGKRPERIVEGLGHRRVAERGVLGMDVEVPRVPAGVLAGPVSRRRARAHMGPPPTAGRSRGRSPPAMRPCRRSRPRAATRPPRRPARPPTRLPGSDRDGSLASCVPAGGASGSRGTAPRSRTHSATPSRPGGSTLPSRGTRAPPTGAPERGTRFPQPEVEHVPDAGIRGRLGLVVAVAHAHRRRAGRHDEREHHVGALERGVELARDHAVGLQRRVRGAGAARRRAAASWAGWCAGGAGAEAPQCSARRRGASPHAPNRVALCQLPPLRARGVQARAHAATA